MTKADQVRALAAKGVKPEEIASELGIRYQHTYNPECPAGDESQKCRRCYAHAASSGKAAFDVMLWSWANAITDVSICTKT